MIYFYLPLSIILSQIHLFIFFSTFHLQKLMELQKRRLDSDNMIKISGYWDSLPFRSFKTEMFKPLFSLYISGQYAQVYKYIKCEYKTVNIKRKSVNAWKGKSRHKNVEEQICKIQIVPVLTGQHNLCIDKVLMFVIHPS